MSKKKILIVDDDPMARRALARTLSDDDFEVVQASNPTDGLEILAKNDVQVVLSDFHMGREKGSTFLSIVEQRHPNVVRILLTSDTSTEVFVSSVNVGHARRVLYKPWHDEQVQTVVRQAFGMTRRAAKKPVAYSLRPPSARTLTKLKALLGVETLE